jgi:hypothetical protein
VWSHSDNGVMDAETLANACRRMFVAMRTYSARAARLTRERDMLLRSRDEARFTLDLRAARLRTLAQELGREADNLCIVEPRAESERPLKRSHYDERPYPRFPSGVLVASSAPLFLQYLRINAFGSADSCSHVSSLASYPSHLTRYSRAPSAASPKSTSFSTTNSPCVEAPIGLEGLLASFECVGRSKWTFLFPGRRGCPSDR